MFCSKLRYILMSACAIGLLTLPTIVTHADELVLAPDASISQLQVGSEILIELTNQSESFRVEQIILNASGSRTVIAKPVDTEVDGFYIATYQVASTSNSGQSNYVSESVAINGTSYFADSISTASSVIGHNQQQFSTNIYEWPHKVVKNDTEVLYDEREQSTADDIAVIDIHFHFNNLVRDHYGDSLTARIEHILNAANMFFEESNIQLRVAGRSSYMHNPHRPSNDMLSSYLFFERDTPLEFDFRTLHGHDVVLLLNLNFPSEYGCATTSNVNPLIENYSAHAVGVLSIDCPDESLARAIAATLGVQRSHYSGRPEDSTFDFGFGHGEKGKFYTMMPNRDDFLTSSNPLPKKIYRFSSPDTICEGVPCGVAEGQPLAADAVKAINLVRFAAADSNSPITDTRHFDEIIKGVSDSGLQNCLRNYYRNHEYFRSSYISTWGDTLSCIGYFVQNLEGISEFKTFTKLSLRLGVEADISALGKMKQLKHLFLEGSKDVTGTDAIGELINLETLRIDGPLIENLQVLNNLVNLRELIFESSYQDFRTATDLGNMKSLEVLDLERPYFEDLSILTGIPSLRYIRIFGGQIQTTAPMRDWQSKPTEINFSRNRITGTTGLEAHPQLQYLTMESNADVGDLSGLRNVNNLIELNLRYSMVDSFEPISELPKLRKLALISREVTSIDSLPPFNDLYSLELLLYSADDSAPLLMKIPEILANAERFGQRAGIGYSFNQAPCWQRSYFDVLMEHQSFDRLYPTNCRHGGDELDYDEDGVSNIDEVHLRRNPFVAETFETRRKALDLIDFDGDQKSDLFVRNTETFYNYGRTSEQESILRLVFGLSKGDIPLHGDYDGDGITDLIMRRPATSMWYISTSSDPGPRGDYIQRIRFGLDSDDVPFVADFDGDGKDDLGVYRSKNKTWYLKMSSDPGDRGDYILRISFPDKDYEQPFVGDFDGDGKVDVGLIDRATYRPTVYHSFVQKIWSVYTGTMEAGDIFVPADYDGDGITDFAYRRPSTHAWQIRSSILERRNRNPYTEITFGLNEDDIPIVADYDGDGLADIAVRRPSTSMQYILNSSGEPGPYGDGIQRIKFGLQQHYIPVAAPISVKMKMLAEQQ